MQGRITGEWWRFRTLPLPQKAARREKATARHLPGLACGCSPSCQRLAEQRKGHAHPEGLSDTGCRGLAGCWGAEKMMSESLFFRHSENSSWDRPFRTRTAKWHFPHQSRGARWPRPWHLARLDCWDHSYAEADKSSPHLTERYSRPQL